MQVSIQNVTFPQPGRKYGKLQLTDGQTIWVPPELLGMFRGGMVAEIATKQQTWGQGADARTVMIATTGPMQPGMGQNTGQVSGAYPQPYPAAQPQQGYQRPTTGFQPRVYEGGGQRGGAPRSDADAKMIFVTGVVGRAMGSGKFSASEIAVLAQEACRVFDLMTRPSPPPQAALQGANQWPEEPPAPEAGDPGPAGA